MKGDFSGDTKILARGCSQRKIGQSHEVGHLGGYEGIPPQENFEFQIFWMISGAIWK